MLGILKCSLMNTYSGYLSAMCRKTHNEYLNEKFDDFYTDNSGDMDRSNIGQITCMPMCSVRNCYKIQVSLTGGLKVDW